MNYLNLSSGSPKIQPMFDKLIKERNKPFLFEVIKFAIIVLDVTALALVGADSITISRSEVDSSHAYYLVFGIILLMVVYGANLIGIIFESLPAIVVTGGFIGVGNLICFFTKIFTSEDIYEVSIDIIVCLLSLLFAWKLFDLRRRRRMETLPKTVPRIGLQPSPDKIPYFDVRQHRIVF